MNCLYCNVHIDEHPASRCLDTWVAEAVMGLSLEPTKHEWKDMGSDLGWGVICSRCYETLLYKEVEDAPPDGCVQFFGRYSTSIAAAKQASDKAGSAVIFAPRASVRDGCYANRKKDWLVEIIPHEGTTEDAVWAYGNTEELARCRAAIKATLLDNSSDSV